LPRKRNPAQRNRQEADQPYWPHNAFAAARTLGARCDRAEAGAPRPVGVAAKGEAPLKTTVISIVLHCSTGYPLA